MILRTTLYRMNKPAGSSTVLVVVGVGLIVVAVLNLEKTAVASTFCIMGALLVALGTLLSRMHGEFEVAANRIKGMLNAVGDVAASRKASRQETMEVVQQALKSPVFVEAWEREAMNAQARTRAKQDAFKRLAKTLDVVSTGKGKGKWTLPLSTNNEVWQTWVDEAFERAKERQKDS